MHRCYVLAIASCYGVERCSGTLSNIHPATPKTSVRQTEIAVGRIKAVFMGKCIHRRHNTTTVAGEAAAAAEKNPLHQNLSASPS